MNVLLLHKKTKTKHEDGEINILAGGPEEILSCSAGINNEALHY